MSRLLSADFARLFKNKYFWICSIFMAGFGVFMQVMNYVSCVSNNTVPHPDTIFFSFSLLTGILLSAFVSLFIGTEYSDGTMRNKLVIGHTRYSIYLSGLITCIAAGLLMCLFCLIASIAAGLPLSDFFANDIRLIIGTALGIAAASAAFASLCTLTAMVCQNRAVTAVINILLVFFLLFAAVYIRARLDEPETYPSYVFTQDGPFQSDEEVPNPSYPSGTTREIYQFLNAFLPGGQAVQYTNMEAENIPLLAVYSAGITVAAAGAGMCMFRRKDIK